MWKRAGWIALVVGAVVVLLGAGLWELHRYLASQRVAALVSTRLEAILGVPVRVARVDAGVEGSTLEGVELFEPETTVAGQPWATIERADVDLPSWDLARGYRVPRAVTLHGVTVTLRYNPAGHPETRLPKLQHIIKPPPRAPEVSVPARQLPPITIDDGRLIYRQEGHADLVIRGIRGEIRCENGRPALTCTVNDPNWGSWVLNGRLSADDRAGSVLLSSVTSVPIRRSVLDQIPFVDRSLWDQIQVEGESPVVIALAYDSATRTVRYRAVLEPTALFLRVPRYDLRMREVRGKILVENNVIHLGVLHGRLAGGEIAARGDLRFRNTLLDLRVAVDLSRLETDRLPREWGLPPEVTGRLSGEADLRTTIRDGRAVFHGEGKGTITDAHVARLPARPIPVTMTANARGFHFRFPPPSLRPLRLW